MTVEPKLWSERDFDECCYAVSGLGPQTMVCATPCRGSYCDTHRRRMALALKIPEPRPPKVKVTTLKPLAERPLGYVYQAAKVDQIIDRVAARYGLTGKLLKSKARSKTYAAPRQEACYRIRQLGRPWSQVAAAMGLHDHTSAMLASRKYEGRLAEQGRAAA